MRVQYFVKLCSKFVYSYMYISVLFCYIAKPHTYRLTWTKISDDGSKALAEGLQHCTNLQELK